MTIPTKVITSFYIPIYPQEIYITALRKLILMVNYVYSDIVVLHNKNISGSFIIFPNPANNYITITAPTNGAGKTQIILYDAVGRQLNIKIMSSAIEDINTTSLPDGTYVLKISNNGSVTTQKILIIHR